MMHAGRSSAGSRGFTFLETVAAVALLSVIIATIFSASDFMFRSQIRERQMIACAEVANRLILQYLDDKDAMPASGSPIEYGPNRYRWSLSESNITVRDNLNRDTAGSRFPGGRFSSNRLERMLYVNVTVWLSEESGGSRDAGDNTPSVTLSRVIDPAGLRNPDAINRMMSTDAGMRRLMEAMIGSGGGRSPTSSPPVPAPAPAPGGTR